MLAVPIHVPSNGLPEWQQVLLTILGCLIAFGLLYLLALLLPKSRRTKPPAKPEKPSDKPPP